MNTKIFLDSGDPGETREVLSILGFLDGQTTNPSLIAKNPETAEKKFTKDELIAFYRKVVEEVSGLIPDGSVSIEVYADASTSAERMLNQGREFFKWIPNAHIKFPTTKEGLKAAEKAIKEGMRVNMTLCFSQQQAAAVYAATKGAKKGDVFVSPFVGRLDDRGENGMDLVKNIIKMYLPSPHSSPSKGEEGGGGDGHVKVLTASVRSLDHLLQAINLGSDILTAPLKILQEWASLNFPSPGVGEGLRARATQNFFGRNFGNPERSKVDLKPILYQQINLNKPWQEYNIQHELTAKGIEKFSADWNNLII